MSSTTFPTTGTAETPRLPDSPRGLSGRRVVRRHGRRRHDAAHDPAIDAALPFGGYKQSGWGRELGPDALDLYTQTQTVVIALRGS